jgi:hypothetical protein
MLSEIKSKFLEVMNIAMTEGIKGNAARRFKLVVLINFT